MNCGLTYWTYLIVFPFVVDHEQLPTSVSNSQSNDAYLVKVFFSLLHVFF